MWFARYTLWLDLAVVLLATESDVVESGHNRTEVSLALGTVLHP